MATAQLHHLSITIPRPITAQDLPALAADLFGVRDLDPVAVRQPKGRHGYRECYSLQDQEGELVAILLDGCGTLINTAHITIHGRAWERGRIDPVHVCRWAMDNRAWSTGVHLAMDDTGHILPWPQIQEISTSPKWDKDICTTLCRPRKDKATGETVGAPVMLTSQTGTTLYYGVRESDTSVCAYDRRGTLRIEYRTRTRGGATEIVRRIAEGDDLGTLTAGVLARVLRFKAQGPGRKDHRPLAPWWEEFLGSAEPIQLPRHRPTTHRSPWYVPPTRADKARKAVQRCLVGDATDSQVIGALRDLIDAVDTAGIEFGSSPCNYQSPLTKVEQNQGVTKPCFAGSLPPVLPVSGHHIDLPDFCPEITF